MFFFYCTICSKMSSIVVSVALFQPIFPHPVFFLYSIPHLTAFYRILPIPTLFYRILPIRGPLSDCRTDNDRITIGKRGVKIGK